MGKSNNEFEFQYEAQTPFSSISFTEKSHKIGDEKNWGGVETKVKDKTLIITVKADRHGSETPAKFYKNFVDGDTDHMIHTERGSNSPDKLNFAVIGTLTINDASFEVCLGQGHYSTTNNWHLCAANIEAQDNNKGGELLIEGTALQNQFFLSPSGSNKFKIKNVSQLSGSHDNDFKISVDGAEVTEISFEATEAMVTVGEPYKGVSSKTKDKKGIITIKAGRHKSKPVAEWYNDAVGKGTSIASYTFDKQPGELNFAVLGTMKITTDKTSATINNILLGQGSNIHIQNNWWVGHQMTKGINLPIIGGGLLFLDLSSVFHPKIIVIRTILDTNDFSATIVTINKKISSIEEITPEMIEEAIAALQ